MAKLRTSGIRTKRTSTMVRPPKVIGWYDPRAVRELRGNRVSAYKAAIKMAAQQEMDWFTMHRLDCAVMKDDEDECTCCPLIFYVGASA